MIALNLNDVTRWEQNFVLNIIWMIIFNATVSFYLKWRKLGKQIARRWYKKKFVEGKTWRRFVVDSRRIFEKQKRSFLIIYIDEHNNTFSDYFPQVYRLFVIYCNWFSQV